MSIYIYLYIYIYICIGSIPTEVFGNEKLQYLDLGSNVFSNDISMFPSSTTLTHLDISHNVNIKGDYSASTEMSALLYLDVSYTDVSG